MSRKVYTKTHKVRVEQDTFCDIIGLVETLQERGIEQSCSLIRRLARQGKIPSFQKDGKYWFVLDKVQPYFTEFGAKLAAAAFSEDLADV